MHKHEIQESWAYLLNELNPDIALLQETVPPTDHSCSSYLIYGEAGDTYKGKRGWGSAVLTKNMTLRELSFENQYAGALVGGEVTLSNEVTLTVFSLYGLMEHGYSTTTVHRMLSDLTFILNGEGVYKGKNQRVIIGGDFNASLQCDEDWRKKHPRRTYYRNAHRILFARLRDFNLHNCFSRFYSSPVQTLRHRSSEKPWQNDYIFVTGELQSHLTSCKVIDSAEVKNLSDHNPVIAEFDINGFEVGLAHEEVDEA